MSIRIEEENRYLTKSIIDINTGKKVNLPHGSGIDGEYNIIEKDDKYIIQNEYHCMDEYGGYNGWIPFELVIPKHNPFDFSLHFIGLNSAGWYRVYKYMLREYLEDAYAYVLLELL